MQPLQLFNSRTFSSPQNVAFILKVIQTFENTVFWSVLSADKYSVISPNLRKKTQPKPSFLLTSPSSCAPCFLSFDSDFLKELSGLAGFNSLPPILSHLQKLWQNTHNIKSAIITILTVLFSNIKYIPLLFFCNNPQNYPDWRGSLGWASSHKAKGHWFRYLSGHLPGLQARSPVGACVRGNWSILLSLSFSLPSPISKNK